jgi:hypothetical protein
LLVLKIILKISQLNEKKLLEFKIKLKIKKMDINISCISTKTKQEKIKNIIFEIKARIVFKKNKKKQKKLRNE